MQRIVVGVLRGGPSSEYEVSLNSGATVLQELDKTKYEARDLFISRDGTWHSNGREMPISRALQGIDVAFNAMHGEYGEDGTIQHILHTFGTPYTGSDSVSSAIAFNKQHTKGVLYSHGIRMANGFMLELPDEGAVEKEAHSIFRSVPSPWVVKPAAAGSSVGVNVATDYHGLIDALGNARTVGPKILIEEFIRGREATCGVTDSFRGEDVYAFFPVEIIPPKGEMSWSYESKYNGKTQELCPSTFSDAQKEEITHIAKEAHKKLGLRHYSRSDMIVTPKGVYFLEINTLPGLTGESLLPKAVKAAGTKLGDFFDHLIQLALRK